MIQENLDAYNVDPDDVFIPDTHPEKEQTEKEDDDDDAGYDILPSNGPGLAGDDGEQVVEDDGEGDDE